MQASRQAGILTSVKPGHDFRSVAQNGNNLGLTGFALKPKPTGKGAT